MRALESSGGEVSARVRRKIRIKKLEASSLYDSGLLRECQTNAQAQPRGQEVRRKRERWKWWWRNFMPSTVVHASRGCERYEGEKIEAGHSGVEDGSGAGGAEDSFPGPGKAREPAAARSPESGGISSRDKENHVPDRPSPRRRHINTKYVSIQDF